MGRSFVTTGRMVMMRSIGYRWDERKKQKTLTVRMSRIFVGVGVNKKSSSASFVCTSVGCVSCTRLAAFLCFPFFCVSLFLLSLSLQVQVLSPSSRSIFFSRMQISQNTWNNKKKNYLLHLMTDWSIVLRFSVVRFLLVLNRRAVSILMSSCFIRSKQRSGLAAYTCIIQSIRLMGGYLLSNPIGIPPTHGKTENNTRYRG